MNERIRLRYVKDPNAKPVWEKRTEPPKKWATYDLLEEKHVWQVIFHVASDYPDPVTVNILQEGQSPPPLPPKSVTYAIPPLPEQRK